MNSVVLSVYDFQRLSLLLQKYKDSPFRERLALNSLEQKLERAVLLPPEQIPPNVVTLYSTVRVTDLVTRKSHQFTLVFPKETAKGEHRISILATIGIALLGEWVAIQLAPTNSVLKRAPRQGPKGPRAPAAVEKCVSRFEGY